MDADPTGRAVARLQGHGPVRALVVGAFGEFSEDLHTLITDLVQAKIPGTPEDTRAARSVAIPWVRRQIAVAAMKRQADTLINGLAFCGPGGAEAYARRDTAQWKDKAARAQSGTNPCRFLLVSSASSASCDRRPAKCPYTSTIHRTPAHRATLGITSFTPSWRVRY